jgi:pyridoxal 5'-phosphate synthase pdxT subunit
MKIGVLALQGDFAMHAKALERCRGESRSEDIQAIEVRKPEQLADVDGLIMPGGESTTLLKLMDAWGFVPALEKFHAEGRPIFGTCAGLILLARDVETPSQFSLGFIDVGVERNAYGRQRESFEARGSATLEGRATPVEMVFIRAPRIRRVGAGVETLATWNDEPVMARQGSVLVATFHPELTDDSAVHEYFCSMVRKARAGAAA